MRPDIESTSYFYQVAAALELSAEEKNRAWEYMTKSNVGRDDPTAIFFCILSKMDGLTSGMSGDMAKSGAALMVDMRANLSSEMKTQLASLPASLSEKLDARMADYIEQLANGIDGAITKEAARRQTFRLGGFALGAVLLAAVTCGGGYILGRDAINAEATKWAALVSLPDGGQWLSLARMNNLAKVMAQSCGPNDGTVISGGKVCDLRLFTTAPVASSQGTDYVRLSLAEYANKMGWLGYVLFAIAGAVVGSLWRGRRQ